MRYCLNNESMRDADAATIAGGVSSEVLMQRAGRAIYEELKKLIKQLNAKSVLFVCGSGNNGGDGYVAANLLREENVKVSVFAAEYSKPSTDCIRERVAYKGDYSTEIVGDIIVDCLFGTGLNREVSGEYATVIEKINKSSAYVLSADIPSGLNGDNGFVMGKAVKANLTVCIAYPKLGLYLNDGIDYCGKIVVCDIGIKSSVIDANVVEYDDVKEFFPQRKRNSHKGSYGSGCVVAGSKKYLGAAALSVGAILKSGCGYAYGVVPKLIRPSLVAKYPQCIYVKKPNLKASAIAFGMGCGCNLRTYKKVCKLLRQYSGKLIIDADGLNSLAKYGKGALKQTKASVIITPHIGEMARLCGLTVEDVKRDPVAIAKSFSKEYGVTVHLKSATSITVEGDNCTITQNGNSALAKAGSGDILSGLMCGYAARGLSLFDSAVCAQFVLGEAAIISSLTYSEYAVTSKELIGNISLATKRLTD